MERLDLAIAQEKYFWIKKTVPPMVVSKSKYTVKGTSPNYLKLSWKEIISPLLKQ